MGHKLLLADDSITIQRVIELTFAEEDVQVLAVGDGKRAIDRIQTDRPDIVLADVGMPERDGYEVAAFIKGNPQLAHIPVLLLTGAFEPIDETRARAVGCDGVLVKPFEPQMVINRVKDLLAGRRPGGLGSASAHAPAAAGQPPAAPHEVRHPSDAAKPAGDSLEDYFDRLDAAFATLGTESGPPSPTPNASGGVPPSPTLAASRPAAAGVHDARSGRAGAEVEDFASWDPDLAGDPARPAVLAPPPVMPPAPPPGVPVAPVSVHVSVTAPPAAPYAPPPAPVASIMPAAAPATPPPASPVAAPPQITLSEAFAALLAAEYGQAISPAPGRPAAAPSPEVVDDIVRRVLDRLTEKDRDVRQTVVDVAERLVREEIDRIKRAAG